MKTKNTFLLNLFLFFSFSLLSVYSFGQSKEYKSQTTTDTLMYEEFNYPSNTPPTGWSILGDPMKWIVNVSQMAGGTAPELALGYSFVFGTSRIVSPVINIENYNKLHLMYKQYLINYEMDYGEIIGIDVAFDEDTNWIPIWQQPLGTLDIPQGDYELFFNAPESATQMKLAFRFEGNSYAINWWLIDDLFLKPAIEKDLKCNSFIGNTTPIAGVESNYNVEVINCGKQPQSDYSVKLMKTDGTVLDLVAGDSINFAEKKTYQLSWTPSNNDIGNDSIYCIIDFSQDENLSNNRSKNLGVSIQQEDISTVQIGNGTTPVSYMPYAFFNLYNLSQTLYFPSEIGVNKALIKGIVYTNQFDESLQNLNVRIWMGETNLNDLSADWINPSTLTPVFDGTLNFEKGFNQTYIPLDNFYEYNGGNLVIYSYKTYDQQIIGAVFFNTVDTASSRSRALESDSPLDPTVTPTIGYYIDYYPNIKLLYTTITNSINNVENSVDISVFPNPTSNLIYVNSTETITKLKLINSLGQVVYQTSVNKNNNEVNISELNSGFYILQVQTNKGLVSKKIQIYR